MNVVHTDERDVLYVTSMQMQNEGMYENETERTKLEFQKEISEKKINK